MHDGIDDATGAADPTTSAEAGSAAVVAEEALPGTRIVVNGKPCTVAGREIGQAALVRLAFPLVPRAATRSLTVAFTRGPASRPEGFVAPGETVEVREGQDFVVVVADQS